MTAQLKPSVCFTVNAQLTEAEARVLELLSQFSNADVMQALNSISREFKLTDVAPLMDNIRSNIRPQVYVIDKARKALSEALSQPKEARF